MTQKFQDVTKTFFSDDQKITYYFHLLKMLGVTIVE